MYYPLPQGGTKGGEAKIMGMLHMMGQVSGENSGVLEHCPMMFGLAGMGAGWMWLIGIFWLVTWGLVIAVLFALLRWLWKRGEK